MSKIFFILFFWSAFSQASPSPWERLSPAQKVQWLRILHYSGNESPIITPSFFVSTQGATDAALEFNSSVALLNQQSAQTPAESAFACRFPFRLHFLEDSLKQSWPRPHCPIFEEWRAQLAPARIEIVFASSFLGNPASSFGHTLIKIVRRDSNGRPRHDLLSWGVSYGANVTTDNPLAYMWKGTFGLFDGFFSVEPYYEKLRNYNSIDDRDLWEFNLNLTPEQLESAIDHLWEIRTTAMPYLFFDRNCSFQLLTFLEAVLPDLDVSRDLKLWVLPRETLRRLQKAGLIGDFRLRPSREKIILAKWNSLSPEQKNRTQQDLKTKTLSGQEDPAVTDLLLDMNLLKINQSPQDQKTKDFQNSVIQARENLPAQTSTSNLNVVHPSEGPQQPSHDRAFGAGMSATSTNNFIFGGRVNGKAWFEPEIDPERQAELILGDYRFRATPTSLGLDRFDVVRIISMPVTTPLFPHWSWRFSLGARERQTWKCDECLLTKLAWEAGKNWKLNQHLYFYILAGAKAEGIAFDDEYEDMGVTSVAGFNIEASSTLGLSLEGGPTLMRNRDGGIEWKSFLRYMLTNDWMIAADTEHERYLDHEIKMSRVEVTYRF